MDLDESGARTLTCARLIFNAAARLRLTKRREKLHFWQLASRELVWSSAGLLHAADVFRVAAAEIFISSRTFKWKPSRTCIVAKYMFVFGINEKMVCNYNLSHFVVAALRTMKAVESTLCTNAGSVFKT